MVPADFNGIRILLSLYLEIERGEKRDGEKLFLPYFFLNPAWILDEIFNPCSSSVMHLFEKVKHSRAGGAAAKDALPRSL